MTTTKTIEQRLHERANTGFCGFMYRRVGPNWVIRRRTKRIVAKYGFDVVCLSQKAFNALKEEYAKEQAAP